ncbi:MAG TPA: pilus assembly protein PilM [Dongiaceae bacterium]|nr:pilus assembly protein PilM [Dongiaceae bacterium]
MSRETAPALLGAAAGKDGTWFAERQVQEPIMGLTLYKRTATKRDRWVSIDLGGRTTKAVELHRNGKGLVLSSFVLLDAPIYQKGLSPDLLAEHLKNVIHVLGTGRRSVILSVGVSESLVRHADLPGLPMADLRLVLKNNSKNYLQQDLPGHVFDCTFIAPASKGQSPEGGKPGAAGAKHRVLVAGARTQLLEDIQAAVKSAGLVADEIVPGLIGPVNAFEMAMPEVFSGEVVALVDIGFKNTSICLLQQGQLVMSRVVAIGGDKLTCGVAEALGIGYAEADGIKVGMPTEVHALLESLLLPLGRELRASLDFFEHQQDKPVARVFFTGASARSEFVVRTLQTELLVECKPWNPVSFLRPELPAKQAAELDQAGPQLTVAIGAAIPSL